MCPRSSRRAFLAAAAGVRAVAAATLPPVREIRRGGMIYRQLGQTDINVSLLSFGHFMANSGRLVNRGGEVLAAARQVADVVLVEKATLTSGSTWHAAGGMHTLNGDPNVARLQQYTVNLYKEIEKESGQNCGIHLPGGIQLADTPERLDWLKMAKARGRYLNMDLELISVSEAKKLFPLMEVLFRR